jgi:hypothetical protein
VKARLQNHSHVHRAPRGRRSFTVGASPRVSATARLAHGSKRQRPFALRPKPCSNTEGIVSVVARNLRYRDKATADPPNKTLEHLPARGVIVWAVIFQSDYTPQKPIRLDLSKARRLPRREGAYVAGGLHELTGSGPRRAHSVIVRRLLRIAANKRAPHRGTARP